MIHADFRCEFYFIRHGESVTNKTSGFAAGTNFDAPLTDNGVYQAQLLGERLKRESIKFDLIYSSSLTRAIQTTQTMLTAMGEGDRNFPKVADIKEQQNNGWRGVPTKEVFTPENKIYMLGKGTNYVPPQGESLRMVQRRVSNWLEDEILYNDELNSRPISLRVAVIGHGTALRCLFQFIMGFDAQILPRMLLDNASISRFIFDRQGWAILGLNDSFHLGTNGPLRVPTRFPE